MRLLQHESIKKCNKEKGFQKFYEKQNHKKPNKKMSLPPKKKMKETETGEILGQKMERTRVKFIKVIIIRSKIFVC